MAESNFNLRGIPPEVMKRLRHEAKKLRITVNVLILQMIEKGLRLSSKKFSYHDLDHLAGSWSLAESRTLEKNTKPFEKVDKKLWS